VTETCVYTVGIGVWRGGTLAELETELARVRREHGAPDDAKITRAAPGSTYVLEVIWIGPINRQVAPQPVRLGVPDHTHDTDAGGNCRVDGCDYSSEVESNNNPTVYPPGIPHLSPPEGFDPTCQKCDYDLHTCPGCGEPVRHGRVACNDCDNEAGGTQ